MGWLGRFVWDDRVLLGGLAISAVGWLFWAPVLLAEWRDDAEIKPVQPKTQYITQETEDALKLGTLDTLLDHYNQSIRETSAKIVCDRAVNDKATVDFLLWGITRKDYDERMKNLRALAIITDPRELFGLVPAPPRQHETDCVARESRAAPPMEGLCRPGQVSGAVPRSGTRGAR